MENNVSEGNGPFSQLGDDIYNIYWKYYPKYRVLNEGDYHSLEEFLEWYPLHKDEVEVLRDYSYEATMELLDDFMEKFNKK